MRAPPVAQPEVLPPSGVPLADALGVAHPKGSDLVVDGPGDDGLGCLAVGVMDPAAVTGLRPALGPPQLAPSPGSPLAPARGLPTHLPRPGLGVGEAQVALGPHACEPPGDKQGLA